jgi:trehalose 6-phosphate synthase
MTPEVVVASDRGPIGISSRAGELVAERLGGGLVSTLECATAAIDGGATWIATTTSEWDGRTANDAYARAFPGARVVLDCVRVEPDEYRAYYDDAGIRLLWFAHHDLWEEVGRPRVEEGRAMRAYERVNCRVAERVAAIGGPDSLVLFQDYQLATAPGALRALHPDRPTAHVTYTPFGPPAAFDHLSGEVLRAIVSGMLGADLVGFLHRPWADCFLACCRLVGAQVDTRRGLVRQGGRGTWVRCYPLGTDLRPAAGPGPAPPGAVRHIMRADRLDPSKNAIRGFQAFELLLERRPDLRGQVVFASFPVPSRERVTEYRAYQQRLGAEVERINARFPGSIEIHPGRARQEALAALRGYDVLLVNSLRDGMNLVAQEGPVVNAMDGCVVLSASTGSAGLLGEDAVLIHDPRDVVLTAERLESALDMPLPERRLRASRMRATIQAHRPERWLADQVADLRAVCRGDQPAAGAW